MMRQMIFGSMDTALEQGEFQIYYQPQYDHVEKRLIGAEALVRWFHPTQGQLSPENFIPILEDSGFIFKLDLYVFEEVCKLLRYCLDHNIPSTHISVNASRFDIYQLNYVESLENIRNKYGIPVELLHIEITESATINGVAMAASVLNQLHKKGYTVEMDDFGSGYSSLNVLKDLEVDLIKLDMRFFRDKIEGRGGTIISSVVRMAKWLNTPVIAEGVETLQQADYMAGIGCRYIQGYCYSQPIPKEDFLVLLKQEARGEIKPDIEILDRLNVFNFWNPESLETLIFSNYVSGACVFTYKPGEIEFLRVNRKFLKELGMNISEQDILSADMRGVADEENRQIMRDMLKQAMISNDEEECEVWMTFRPPHGRVAKLAIRIRIRVIGRLEDQCLFFCAIRNITKDKLKYKELYDKYLKLQKELSEGK